MKPPCDWDGLAYCIEPACVHPATHQRLVGMHDGQAVYELVCCVHAMAEHTVLTLGRL